MADTQLKETTGDPDLDLLARVKDRFHVMAESDEENRRLAMDDLKFVNVPGEQWDNNMKQLRGERPCYEFNKVRISCKRIINDMRANRPQGKVRAVEQSDKTLTEINEGLCRNIWSISDGDSVIDNAAEYQVAAGMACWRVVTEYSDDDAFDQDIKVHAIQNPFCLYVDPACKDFLKRDADDWVLTEKMSEEEYRTRWPKAEINSFEDQIEFDDEDWHDDDQVRIAEYWYKTPVKKTLWMVPGEQGNMVVDADSDEAQAMLKNGFNPEDVKTREVMTHKIEWCIVSSEAVLERGEWASREFPFIMIYGEWVYVDGRMYWWGLPRFAKDAQRSYNVARTAVSETIAQAPKSYMWATTAQAKGLESQWTEAHRKNYPWMLYNPDPKAPGPPTRVGGADIPAALIQETQLASDEIKAVTGIYDASLGDRGNETSGRAIYARQQQGEIATFNYQDNMAKGIQRTWEIMLSLIPEIYDTERELRIIGSDGAEAYHRVNQTEQDPATGQVLRINDMASGKYDVTVTVGPNFSTLRQEAAETYGNMAQQFPEIMGFAGDLIMKSMDLPYAEDIADRMKAMLPPQIQQQLEQGEDVPPEVQQMMQQAEQAMAQVQEYGQLVQAAAQELEEEQALNEKQKAEIQTAIAQLKQAEAEFKAEIAQTLAGLTEKKADLISKGAALLVREAEVGDAADTHIAVDMTGAIDEVLAGFMGAVDNAMGKIDQQTAWLASRATRKPVGGTTSRSGGKLTANVEYDDGSTESVSAVREKGGLKIVPPEE